MKNPQFLRLLILTTAIAAVRPAATVAGEWTGNGPSLNWSEPNNWDPATTPTSASYLFFSDVFYQSAYTNAAGLVNNIVDTSYTAGGINFNTLSGSTAGNHHYTTLIPAGITLTVDGGTPGPIGEPAFLIGNYLQTSGSLTNYTTINGEGSLGINNPASVINVRQVSRATLDLSGLNTFTANVASFLTGVPQFDSTATFVGNVLLAKTNTITTAAGLNAPGVLLGSANTGTGTAFLGLGKVNAFNTDSLVVGGLRAGNGTALVFGPGNSNSVPVSTFTLRGSAGGTTPIPVLAVGDLSANYDSFATNRTGSASASSADFSGGVVDILADKIYVGRSANNEVAVSTGTSTGNLIVEQGTVTATNVYIAHKVTATNSTAGQGTLILRNSALMTVYNDLSLCFRTNGTAFINASGLQVRDAAVLNVGGNITTTQTGSGTPAAISLAGGTINLTSGGSVFTPVLNGFGTIAGASSITVTNALSVSDNQSVGTLTLGNNLTLANPFALTFNLGANTTVGGGVNDYLDVANNVTFNNNPITLTYGAPLVIGTYKLVGYGGTQSGSVTWVNPSRSPIGLVQGGGQVAIVVTNLTPASLTWRAAGAGANWEATSLFWNGNTEKFYTFDNVVFDDTGVATNITIAAITNQPGNVTFNNTTKTYTITQSGSGAIGGYAALDKNGTGMLIMGGGGLNNYFTGPVNINAGTIRLGSFNSGVFGTTASTTPINIAAGATLDSFGNGFGSGNSYGRPINVAGTGVGGNGAIVHLNAAGAANPTFNIAGLTLTGDTLLAVTDTKALNFSGIFAPYSGVLDLGGYTLTTAGGGEVRIVQMVLTNSGTINVGGRTLTVRNSIIDGTGSINVGNNILNLGGNNAFTTGYVAKAISVGNGGITAPNQSAFNIPLSSSISIANGGALNITNSQIILASGVINGNGALNKYGNSNLVLSAANTYSGSTIVSGGALTLTASGSLASSLVQVNANTLLDVSAKLGGHTLPSGQTLAVSGSALGNITVGNGSTYSGFGTNLGSITVSASGTVAPGGVLVAGTLTVTNDLTFNGGTNVFKLGSETTPGAGVNDLVVVGGDLMFTAPTTVRIQPVGSMSTQPYTLWQYTGTLTGIENVSVTSSLRPGTTYTLDTNTPGVVQVVIVSASANLIWAGGAPGNPTTWDVASTLNWINGGLADLFYQGDQVTFDNTAVVNQATISSQTQPAAMTNNATGTMVLNGSGSLLAGNLVANSGNFIIANTNNNLFNGGGIILNGGNVSFDQPGNATVTSKFSGDSGFLLKYGTNTLTLVSTDSTNLHAGIGVQAGTLRPVGVNALGTDHVTMQSPATLDINGQVLLTNLAFHIQGHGADGQGAINNRGAAQTNAISALVIHADSTIGAASNRWDVSGAVFGNNNSLTKLGAADIWIRTGEDTELNSIAVNAGRLIFGGVGTTLGTANPSGTLVVASNATIGFANGISAGVKQGTIQNGGSIYSTGSGNQFDGPITLNGGLVQLEPNAQLTLAGDLTGPAQLNLRGVAAGNFGTLTLSGTNTYTGGTLLNDGQLNIADSLALPANTNVTMFSRVAANASGHPIINLDGPSSVVTHPSIMLDMQTVGLVGAAQAWLSGDEGTWSGPIKLSGSVNSCIANFNSGMGGLTVAGTVDGTGFIGGSAGGNGSLRIGGNNVLVSDPDLSGVGVRFNGSLVFTGALSTANLGLGGSPGMTKLVLGTNNNYWLNTFYPRGVIQIDADNALPLVPLSIGTLAAGADHRFMLDLNGHVQTIVNLTIAGSPAFPDPFWVGNTSTNADATLIYAGTGTNIWAGFFLDAYNTSAPIQRKTALSVTAGYLQLSTPPAGHLNPLSTYYPSGPPPYPLAMTYTGPTTISGGTLRVDRELGISPVTVSGTGNLMGTGVISGTITIAAGGKFSPGASIGTITCTSNLLLQAGSTTVFEVNLNTSINDQIVGLNSVTYGGTLVITNIGSQPFTNGTVLQLFSAASYVSGTVTIQPASPGANLTWDTSGLAVDGKLKVIAAPLPSGVTVLPDGNVSFTLTGIPGQPYTVLTSTNVALPLPQWTVLSSGIMPSSTFNFTDLNATNYPMRFYRTSAP